MYFRNYIVQSGEYAGKHVYDVLQDIVKKTDWTDMNMKNKFQHAVNAEGGDMEISCLLNGENLASNSRDLAQYYHIIFQQIQYG